MEPRIPRRLLAIGGGDMVGSAAAQLRERFPGDGYVAFHAPRYVALLELLDELGAGPDTSMLDIGNSPFTDLAADRFGARVDNLGLDGEFETPHGQSYWYDLNLAQETERWRTDLPTYDIVVLAEVIEHLYTAPQLVLGFLKTLLQPGGALVVQTPNGAALHNRLKLLVGKNPYEMIRENRGNPGHFREYTRNELLGLAAQAGFVVERWSAESYFDYRFYPDSAPLRRIGGLFNRFFKLVPPTLRPGQTAILRAAG